MAQVMPKAPTLADVRCAWRDPRARLRICPACSSGACGCKPGHELWEVLIHPPGEALAAFTGETPQDALQLALDAAAQS
jgi:hypothetical protein